MTLDWRHRARCRDEDPELFFPIGNTGPALIQIEDAKAVCRRCPVVTECLTWALDTGQDAGVWGGMHETERRALKRRGEWTDHVVAAAVLRLRAHQATTPGLDRIRDLAARGHVDREIAEQLGPGWNRQKVCDLRARHGIPPGRAARRNTAAGAPR